MALNAELVRQKINLGIRANKSGDRHSAWLHFQAALREDTDNVTALLWLAYLANDDHEKRIFLLERVMLIDPDNQRAQAGLVWAEQELAKQKTDNEEAESALVSQPEVVVYDRDFSDAKSAEEAFILSQKLKQEVGTDHLKEQARKGTIAQRARRRISAS